MDEPRGGTLRLSGQGILTLVFVTQADILTSVLSIRAYAHTSPKTERSPTVLSFLRHTHSFGRLLSPDHFRRRDALPVSYYALFKGWLLLSKPPGCFSILTSFAT